MNRRRFLAALAAGAVVTAEGLWVPGAKLISIPRLRQREVGWLDASDYDHMMDSMRYMAEARQWMKSEIAFQFLKNGIGHVEGFSFVVPPVAERYLTPEIVGSSKVVVQRRLP